MTQHLSLVNLKRGGGNQGLKRLKKLVKCLNSHKKGHLNCNCRVSGSGAEGKGPKNCKRKQKEVAEKSEVKDKEGCCMNNKY